MEEMINNDEKELLKTSWRLIVAFWVVVAGGASFLYSAGFLDLPATARDVKNIKTMVSDNTVTLRSVSRRTNEFRTETALRKSRQIDIERRLGNIENRQREQRKDTKEILRIILSKP